MSVNEYELVLIIRPDLDAAQTTEIVEKVEGSIAADEGTILFRDD